VGPAPEVCDGKDNDCDGVIDNNASCALGYVCIGGECVQTCDVSGENPRVCPADRHCAKGACLVKACARQPCPVGFVCQSDGSCIDPCSLVMCPAGASCVNGSCVDCYTKGCPAGQNCIARQCTVDPCDGKSCVAGQFCYAGDCVTSCAGVSCGASQVCSQGRCLPSACPVACDSDFFCDAAISACRPKPCSGSILCPAGKVCTNATGLCADNPCELVHCEKDQVCVVKDDGRPDCVVPAVPGIPRSASVAGDGLFSCSCSIGAAGSQARGGRFGIALALGMLVAARRRRRP
jgi:hypothetical protein